MKPFLSVLVVALVCVAIGCNQRAPDSIAKRSQPGVGPNELVFNVEGLK